MFTLDIRIHQVSHSLPDEMRYKIAFRSLERVSPDTKAVPRNWYEQVYDNEISVPQELASEDGQDNPDFPAITSKEGVRLDTENVLELVFNIFNQRRPFDFRGHSLSVSDVVEIEGNYYYCDSVGFEKLNKFENQEDREN